eukprot:35496-Chlamydomonas_euryale.AAC.3
MASSSASCQHLSRRLQSRWPRCRQSTASSRATRLCTGVEGCGEAAGEAGKCGALLGAVLAPAEMPTVNGVVEGVDVVYKC